MKQLPYVRLRLRQFLRQGAWFSPVVALTFVGLEVLGRQTVSDVHDTLSGSALLVLLLIIAARHKTAPLAWVTRIGRAGARLMRWFDRFKVDIGLDLRGSPPIPRKTPWGVYVSFALLAAWTAAFAAVWYYHPEGWRSASVETLYTLYLAFVIVLWGVLFLAALAGVYFPVMLLTQLFPRTLAGGGPPRMSRPQLLVVFGYVGVILLANWLLPLWVAPALCAAVLAVLLAARLAPAGPGVSFIWRPRSGVRVYSVPVRRLLLTAAGLVTALLLALIVTACGGGAQAFPALGFAADRLLGVPGAAHAMPVTLMLGTSLAWLTPGLLLSAGVWFFLVWRQSPARPCQPTAHVAGAAVPAVRDRLKALFARWGWRARFGPDAPRPADVRVHLVEPAQSQAAEFDPVWPLRVSLEDLEEGAVRARLDRRDELQKRRLLTRGFEKLLKYARGRHFTGGSGFWLAPHLWLMGGMTRDDIEETDGEEPNLLMRSVGPPYAQLFGRPVRHYLHTVLRAMEVDLIFVEDGIDHRKLNRVMRVLFEVYDKYAGKRRAEEVQFQGLPKVKVLIHDFQLDQPFESSTYPEPRFEDLGRARILHVFRDRGDQEELNETPSDSSRSPAPLWMN